MKNLKTKLMLLGVLSTVTIGLVGCNNDKPEIKENITIEQSSEVESDTSNDKTDDQNEGTITEDKLENEDSSELEEQKEEIITKNPLIESLKIKPVMNGNRTEAIGGNYGIVKISKSAITKEDFIDFSYNKVKGSGLNWVAIDFGDGTGITYMGSGIYCPTYGEIDTDGAILKSIGYIDLTETDAKYVEE